MASGDAGAGPAGGDPPGPVLRPATPADRPALLVLFAAANDACCGRYAPSVYAGRLDIAEWFDRKRLDRSWVLADADGLVGHVGMRRDPEPARRWGLPTGPAWVEVARLAVHPGAQRHGHARRLMAHVHRELAGAWCWLTCHRDSPGHGLYRSLGWQPVDLPIRWPDDPTPGVLLTRTPAARG
ncbi:GNAT family N-acetyltransferase [Geodermatophilus sp. CPCC 205506]|uniref:GNAT family N-acetyltransferase n=1 Tax=Geodermatophilus sp. CPCC 205506 TaxID=2936596 RepID=UPI003EEE821E